MPCCKDDDDITEYFLYKLQYIFLEQRIVIVLLSSGAVESCNVRVKFNISIGLNVSSLNMVLILYVVRVRYEQRNRLDN